MTSAPTVQDIRNQRVTKAFRALRDLVLKLDPDDKHGVDTAIVSMARDLSEHERLVILQVVINSYPAHVADTLVAQCMEGAGIPEWNTGSALEMARFWVTHASSREIDAFAAVCFENMPPERQRAFLEMVSARVDALPERRAANG